ncbi:MAG: FMN-binding protein [Butyrivibrio sp.]|nr:FMN-binding protein [Butyrivibrio sp.]
MTDIKTMIKNAFILFVITLVAGVLLGFVYQVTKEPIAYQNQLAETKANQEVFSEAQGFEEIELDESALAAAGATGSIEIVSVKKALDAAGGTLGYVIQVSSSGYGDDIVFTMGITNDGVLNGISIISINETPGLGMNAEKVLVPQFSSKTIFGNFEVTKNTATADSQIEAISGATITSKAITNGVNVGIAYWSNVLKGGQN